MKKEHRVADITDVVVTRLRRIANSVTVKEIEESLRDLRAWSRCKGRLKAWFEGMCNFLELAIPFSFIYLFIYLFICLFTLIHDMIV